mmetsp:Transcript_49879/g.120862  ORF Transcript_49879/g.120862 Transcript_49879/m.120862 type:complete len:82 (-) Transcript_49879:620-865(-)
MESYIRLRRRGIRGGKSDDDEVEDVVEDDEYEQTLDDEVTACSVLDDSDAIHLFSLCVRERRTTLRRLVLRKTAPAFSFFV